MIKYDISLAYWKHMGQYENVKAFDEIVADLGIKQDLLFPNHDEAPWHVQLVIGDITYNFWPHKLKGHIQCTKHVVEGEYQLRCFLSKIMSEEDDIEVIE